MKKIIVSAIAVVAVIAVAFLSLRLEKGDAPASVTSATAGQVKARVSVQSVTSNNSLAAAGGASTKTVQWEAMNFPADLGVDINLLKKVSDNPATYVFVRKIALNTQNDGTETWAPKSDEAGDDLYIEVVCAANSYAGGCQVTGEPVKAN